MSVNMAKPLSRRIFSLIVYDGVKGLTSDVQRIDTRYSDGSSNTCAAYALAEVNSWFPQAA